MFKTIGNVIGAVALVASMGFAGTAYGTPVFDTFGSLPEATFGGTGIPNDNVAITTIPLATVGSTITLGLTATPRFSNPALTNDGAGTFFAGGGSNFGGAGQSATEGALWNFSFFVDIDNSFSFADFNFQLLYDFDPALDTPDGDLGVIDLNGGITVFGGDTSTVTRVENSQNLLFNFLTAGFPGFVTPPTGSFDPNAAGQYSFALIASALNGDELGRSAIDVNVSAVPIPAALPLFGSALALMGFVSWRRRKSSVATDTA